MTESERLRFSARDEVIFNPSLSTGARCLYVALDSMAGFKGQCWPNQVILAKRLGTTDRALRRWLCELSGIVSMVHRRGANIYLMKWIDGRKPMLQGRTLVSYVNGEGRTLVSGDVGQKCPSYNQAIEPEKQQARELIEKYPFAKDLRGTPDDSLIEACLSQAGDLERLGDGLRAMYLADKRPSLSWAWFKVVLPSYLERRRA